MPAEYVHLVRHGEVDNPGRILYGRLDGYGLSDLGNQMSKRVAKALEVRPIVRVVSSPLLRTRQSAEPIAKAMGLTIDTDERLIEGTNVFEGSRISAGRLIRHPNLWPHLRNPLRPSWGEPYRDIAERMMAALEDAWKSVDSGEVVLVSHQLPIWMLHRWIAGVPLPHLPAQRRCTLSSVTTFKNIGGKWKEESYREPAADLLVESIDLGAV